MATVAGNSDGFGVGVQIYGIREVSRALDDIDPTMKLGMMSAIRGAVNEVRKDAISLAPRGATGDLIASIKVKKGRYRSDSSLGYKVVSDSAQGAILELAGVSSGGHSTQGRSLIRSATSSYGQPGRFVYKAWENTKDVVTERIVEAVSAGERRIQQRINKAGDL